MAPGWSGHTPRRIPPAARRMVSVGRGGDRRWQTPTGRGTRTRPRPTFVGAPVEDEVGELRGEDEYRSQARRCQPAGRQTTAGVARPDQGSTTCSSSRRPSVVSFRRRGKPLVVTGWGRVPVNEVVALRRPSEQVVEGLARPPTVTVGDLAGSSVHRIVRVIPAHRPRPLAGVGQTDRHLALNAEVYGPQHGHQSAPAAPPRKPGPAAAFLPASQAGPASAQSTVDALAIARLQSEIQRICPSVGRAPVP